MAKRQGSRRRFPSSRTWLPLAAAILGLLTTAGVSRLVSVTRAWLSPGSACLPAAAVADRTTAPSDPAKVPRHIEDKP